MFATRAVRSCVERKGNDEVARRARAGVFCLEGPWDNLLTDRSSVRPLLEVLEGQDIIEFAHRDAATIEEFEAYLRQWTQKQYQRLSFGYLAFHGDQGHLVVGKTKYTLERLGRLLEGRLAGRVLYFGSCGTLGVDLDEIKGLRAQTGARAVCSYTEDVDWIESAAFDLNLIDAVTWYDRIDAGFKYLEKNHAGMCDRLGFRAVWASGSIGKP